MIKPQNKVWSSILISNSDSSRTTKKYTFKKETVNSHTNWTLTNRSTHGEWSSNYGSIKEDSMNNLKLLTKLEREISHLFIWSKSTRIEIDMPLRPFLNKLHIVNKKENSAWSRKLKSWDILAIQTIWDFLKSLNLKIHFTLCFNCLAEAVFMTKLRPNINSKTIKYKPLSTESYSEWKKWATKKSCTET